jgi:two-component system NarL family sensor kinase
MATQVVPATRRAPRPAATRLAWALCTLSVTLALAAVALATVNGENLLELVAAHHAIGILDALVLSVVGALIVARDRRHPLAWLLLLDSILLAVFNFSAQYAPLALGLTSRHLSLPGGDLASWLASWTNVPGIVIGVVFLVLLFPDGRLPSRRWWPAAVAGALTTVVPTLILAVGYWPLSGPALLTEEAPEPALLDAMFGLAFLGALVLGAISVVALVLRFRRAGVVERQQIKWFAYGAALSIPLSLFPEADPWGPYAEFLGTVLLTAGLGIGILRYRLFDIDRIISRTVVYGLLTAAGVAMYVGVVHFSEWLLREGAGLGGSLAATAVIAVGFAPARDRLQRWVDRRLYGDRHDPVRAVARLGERLRHAPATGRGEDVLAGVLQGVCETLRLPSASLRTDDGTEVASFGRPSAVGEQVSLEHEGQRVGTLVVGARSGEDALGVADRQVLRILAAPVAVAVHAVLLSQELQRSRERLVAAREEERRRLRRDLHDGLGPILTAVTLKADAARSALDTAPNQTDELLAELRGDAKQAIGDLRRVVEDLRPASLDELGLLGALSQQVDRFARQGLAVTLRVPPTLPVLPAAVEVAAYRIVTEALTNVVRHAHAQHVSVTVAIDRSLCLEVHDDGAASTTHGGGWRPGVGLLSMADRAAEVGGTLQAGPTPTGGRVQASLPQELP